jgi:UDP-N-acetylmuramyl pentapeptide phosphotransferase/UDP-N-acetylglucosamine-1-phosphate transferase
MRMPTAGGVAIVLGALVVGCLVLMLALNAVARGLAESSPDVASMAAAGRLAAGSTLLYVLVPLLIALGITYLVQKVVR